MKMFKQEIIAHLINTALIDKKLVIPLCIWAAIVDIVANKGPYGMMIDYETTHCRIHQVILLGNQIAAVLTETLDPNTACPVTRFIAIDISSSGNMWQSLIHLEMLVHWMSLNGYQFLAPKPHTHRKRVRVREWKLFSVEIIWSWKLLVKSIWCWIFFIHFRLHSYPLTFYLRAMNNLTIGYRLHSTFPQIDHTQTYEKKIRTKALLVFCSHNFLDE